MIVSAKKTHNRCTQKTESEAWPSMTSGLIANGFSSERSRTTSSPAAEKLINRATPKFHLSKIGHNLPKSMFLSSCTYRTTMKNPTTNTAGSVSFFAQSSICKLSFDQRTPSHKPTSHQSCQAHRLNAPISVRGICRWKARVIMLYAKFWNPICARNHNVNPPAKQYFHPYFAPSKIANGVRARKMM